jgi:hypothetical protein
MRPSITLLENFLLFLPLCWAICIFSTAMRRYDMKDVLRTGTRFFVGMTGSVVVVCTACYFVMEYVLSH